MHSELSCTDCHGYRWIPEHNSTDRFGNPIVVEAGFDDINHTWEFSPFPEACSLCHTDTNTSTYINATAAWTTMQGYIGDVDDLVDDYDTKYDNVSAKVDEANETSGVDQEAVDNAYDLLDEADDLTDDAYETAFHNPEFAKEKVQLALTKLEEAYAAAVDAIENREKPASGFELLFIIPAFALVAIFFRKRQ
jgi:hypothetical protein